jgi:hypothetical protein
MNISSARRVARFLLLLALALPLACVNPFKPADPEPPDSSGVPEVFDTPGLVLATMQVALESKSSGGANAWLHALAESTQVGDRAFRAFYDPAVKQVWESGTSLSAPEPWNIGLERGLPSKLFGIRANLSYAFEWTPDPGSIADDDPPTADTAQFHRHYVLRAITENDANPPEVIGIGFVDLSFQRKNGRWSIYRWHDRVDDTVGVNPSNDQRTMSWWRLESLIRP